MPIQDGPEQSRLERMRKRLADLQDRDDLRIIDPGKIRLERNRRLLESAYSEEDKDRLSRAIKRDTPRGFWESLFTDEYGQDTILPISLPFIGSGDSAVEIYRAHLASERGTASYEQSEILKDYYDFTVRPVTTLGKAAGVFREVPAYGAEFYLSGGIGTLGRKAATETAEKGLNSMLKKVLVSGFRKKSIQTGASSLAKMGRALKEAALAAPGQVVRMELQKEGVKLATSLVGIESEAGAIRTDAYMNYIRNRYQIVPVNEYGASVRVIDDSYGMWSSAIPNAVVNNLVEVFSEHTGYAIAHMVPSLKVGLLGKPFTPGGVDEKMLAILGLAGDVPTSKMLQRVGLSGLVPEMGEEFVGALVRDVVHAAAPSLADEGNTKYLIDNIVPITLGMGLGIFGTSAGIGAISYVHGHDHYAKTSSDGKKNFRAMVNAATAPGREGTVKAGSRMIDYIHAGIRGEGASELMADASVRVKFFESEGVQREARKRVGRKIDINDIGGVEKMSTDEVEAEKHLMWEELNQEYLLIEEESEDGAVEVSSPGIERLIELKVITEEEAPQIIEKIQERIDGFRDADKNKAMVEFWKDLGEERVSIELAKAVEAGVYGREGDTAEPEGLKVAAWMKAGRDIEKLKALYKAGKTEALEEEIARTVYDPRLVESEEVVEDRVKGEEAERRLEELVKGDIDAAIEDVNIALKKKGVDDVIELYEDPAPHEKVKEAIDFGLVVVPMSSTRNNVLGFWNREHKILFYNPQAIESRAKDEGLSIDELYAITIYRELLRAHVTDMNEAAREEWLTAAKGWIDELDVKFKKKLVLHKEIYKGELDMAAIESEVTLTLARLSLLGKDFVPPGREPGLIGWLRSFAGSLLEFAIPGAMGSSKRVTAVRAALEGAGVNTEGMSPSQIMMAYASSVHVFDVVGMLTPARDTVEKILKAGEDDFIDVLVDEAPSEAEQPAEAPPVNPYSDIFSTAYLTSLSRKALVDLAKDLREEGINVTNVSGSKDQIIDSILKAMPKDQGPDSYAFMALEEATGPLQQRMTKKIGDQINESAKHHLPKERVKTRQATQFIGRGKAGSSTSKYMQMYNEEGVANTGDYTANDIVYVSSNGKRVGRVNPVIRGELQGVYTNIDKAIKAGASIIMDTAEHLQKTGGYNIGELALADYLATHGYARQGVSGMWKPADKSAQSASRRSYPRLTADVKFGAAAEEGGSFKFQEQFHIGGDLPKAEDFGEGGEIEDPNTGAVWKVRDGEWAKVDDALYAPPSMLVPFSAAVVGDRVIVSDGSVPDYLGEVIEVGEEKTYRSSSTGMLEEGKVSIRPIDETDLVAPNTLLAPWQGPVSPTGQSKRIETSPRNLYHPDLSWSLVEENGEYYWVQAESRKRELVKPRGQTVDREDVVATSAVIFEDMRRTEDLEALVEPPADPKEKEDRGVEGRMSSADELKKARRGRGKKEYKAFARQLSIRAIPVAVFAKFLGVNTAVAARLIRYTATRVQVSEKAIARAVSASRSEESGSMTEKDRDIAEAAIGNAWKQFTAPIRTELQAFFSGILSEPGLEKLVKEATPGTQRRAVLELLLEAYGEVDIRSTAQAGRAHSAKGQAMDPVAYGEHHTEEDQGLGKIEKRSADAGPLLGTKIHRSSIQSIAAHFFTIATALGKNKDYKMFDKWRDKHLPSGQTGMELHWWNTWVRAANILDASPLELTVLNDLLFLTPGEKPYSPPTNGHTDGAHRQSIAAALGVNLQPQPIGRGGMQVFAGALVSDAEVGKVIEALIPVKDIRGLGPMGEFVLKYTPKLSELMIEGKTIATRRLVTEMLQEITSAAKSDTAIAKLLKDAGRVGEKEENVKNLLEAVTKASEAASERDAATMAKVAKRRERGGKGVSAGVSDIVSQAAKSEAAQTSGWLRAVADSKDMRVFKPVFDHIALMAKLYGMKASLELRANNLQTVMRDRGEGEQPSPLTQAITIASSEAAEQYSAQEESLDHLILLVENMRYGEFAAELHSQHASSQEMRISPAKDKYLLAPWGIPRFSESHYTVLNRASMKGYSALGIRVGRGLHNIHGSATIQLVLDPAILGTVGPSPSSVTAVYEMLKSDQDAIDEKRREENLAKDKELNRKRKDAFDAAVKRRVEQARRILMPVRGFGPARWAEVAADFEEMGLWTPPYSQQMEGDAPPRPMRGLFELRDVHKEENKKSFMDFLKRYPSSSRGQDEDHIAFMALSDPDSTSQNYEAAGAHLPSMWDTSELPEIGESKTRTSIFLMAYDKWVMELEHLRGTLDTNLSEDANAVTDYVEGVEGLRGGARIARVNQIRAALLLRMEMEYWAVSGGGRESQKRIHGWDKAKDERGLWRHFAHMKGSVLGFQHKEIFDLTMSIKEDPSFAPIAQVFDRMVEQQALISDLALRSKLIKRKISHHMHLAWADKDAPNIEEWENIGERTGVGGSALHKKYSSVLEGWANGLTLKETDGLLAIKKNGMRVAEAAHNRAILFTMELAGIVERIPPSGNLKEGYTKLEDKIFERHQAEKWVAKFMNNATSRLRISDIKNPYARKYMHTTVMMKHMLLMLGFFHHQAFPRSYFFTVDHKTAWGGFMKLPWIAKASLMSYSYHAGFGTRKQLDEAADRFPGYSAGRAAIEARSPLLNELRRAGLIIQVGEDVRATSSGGGYDMDEVALMDKRMGDAKKWLSDKGVPVDFANKVIDMLNGVRNFQRGTATWLFNSLGSNLKVAQAIAHFEELLEKHKERLKTDYDGSFRLGIATQVSNLSNDDFGGMNHMARGGRIDTLAKPRFLKTKIAMPRHARTTMLARALLLASDWTESNLMTVLRSVWKDGKMADDKEILEIGRKLHQHMWVRVVSRGLFLQILINAVMAGLDDERDIWDLYKEAGFPGYGDELAPKWQKLRWLDINLSMLSPSDSRKFISILGHFADPFHWTMDMFGERGGLMTPLIKKGSPGAKTVLSFIDGADWAGRRFTTWDEFWGIDDDAGIYQRRTKQSDGTYKEAGESKAGRYQFQISRYGLDKGPVGADQMFTYTFEQLRRFLPIQTRTAMDYAMGTKDGFDFIGGMLGFKASRTWPD